MNNNFVRALNYVKKVPAAIQGQNGDSRTFYVACVLRNDFELSDGDSLKILEEWNQDCNPPWHRNDLIKKIENAEKYAYKTIGRENNITISKSDFTYCDLEPIPLYYEQAPAQPFPLNALGNILGPVVRKLIEDVQAPDAVCAHAVMAAASLATQGHANIEIDGRIIALSLYFVSIAESGERKSAVDKIALKPIRQHQETLYKVYRKELSVFKKRIEAYETKLKDIRKSSLKKTLETVEKEIEALGHRPSPPIQPLLLLSDITFPGLYKQLEVGLPSIGIITDEAGTFVGGHGMNKDNQLAMTTGLSNLWDGKPLDRVRAEDGASSLYHKRLTLHLMGQSLVLQILLSNSLISNQGFTNRLLISFPESMVGQRVYKEIDLNYDESFIKYQDKILQLLETRLPVSDEDTQELKPPSLLLTPEAKEEWIKYVDAIERKSGKKGQYSNIQGFVSKIPEQVLRISGVLELIDDIHSKEISLQTIRNSIILTDYYIAEQIRLKEAVAVDKNLVMAKELHAWCAQWCSENGDFIYSTIILKGGPPFARKKDSLDPLIKILVEYKWLVPLKQNTTIKGKPRAQGWKVVRS